MALHDKQIAAIRNLLRGGIEQVAEIRRLTLETRRDLRATNAGLRRIEAADPFWALCPNSRVPPKTARCPTGNPAVRTRRTPAGCELRS